MAEHYGHKMDIEVVARTTHCPPGYCYTLRVQGVFHSVQHEPLLG